jgi:mycothiol system anti-sigma-R factor
VDLSEISCTEVLREIELYLDGELEPDRAAHLAAHLGYCSPCIERADFQAKLRMIIRSKCRTEPPAHLAEQLREAIRAPQPFEGA